jgi:aquaporin NIP
MVDTLAPGKLGLLGVGLVFGLTVCGAIHTIGPISGAHLNPAVTLAFAVTGRTPRSELLPYAATQIAAATAATAALLVTFGPVAELGLNRPTGGAMQSFALEAIMTAFLVFVILGVGDPRRQTASLTGLVACGTIVLLVLFGGPVSGTSLNPARSLGPAIVTGQLDALWVYLAGPSLGACVGAWGYGALAGR